VLSLIVVEHPRLWPLDIPGARVLAARDYLTQSEFTGLRHARVFNLCRSYSYQSVGYYVSLLATARGHRPLPSVTTIQDLRTSAVVRIVSEDLETRLQRTLAPLKSHRFQLSIYFGRNLAARYDRLCQELFNYFPAPLLRAEFVRADQWRLHSLRPIASSDIPDSHRPFVVEQANRFFARPRIKAPTPPRYELAILFDPEEVDAPSDERAITRFVRAAERLGIRVSVIGKEDLGRIAEFDALFIRETTGVNHHTYRFASRASAEGLVVIDDPESIVRCSNKVYQAEMLLRHGLPCPKTLIVHRDNVDEVGPVLRFPVVLKRPDSSFSRGVVKAETPGQLAERLDEFFEDSELVVAQEYVPSSFDWRVGVLDGRALFACRYHMAKGHWQIQKVVEHSGRRRFGKVETLSVDDVPEVAGLAVQAANLIGKGLYGVDIKQADGRLLITEINDNPNIDAGCEDAVLKDDLYLTIMQTFYDRLERQGAEQGRP
jgi:glutathione synthase/RimK-type ligase-like ATP-grasp enzyme